MEIAKSESYKGPHTVLQKMVCYSELIENAAITSLSIFVLASKIFSTLSLGHSAQKVLGYVGVIALNNQGNFCSKTFVDLTVAFRGKDWAGCVALSAKVADQIITIMLIAGSILAAISLALKKEFLLMAVFNALAPIGVTLTIVSLALDIFQFIDNRRVEKRLAQINAMPDADNQKSLFLRSLVEKTYEEKKPLFRHLKPMVIRQIDPYTWNALKHKIKQSKQLDQTNHLFDVICQNNKKQRVITESNLALTALGYLSGGVCKSHPDTIFQSAVYCGMSSLYTTKLGYQAWKELQIQKSIQA